MKTPRRSFLRSLLAALLALPTFLDGKVGRAQAKCASAPDVLTHDDVMRTWEGMPEHFEHGYLRFVEGQR